MRSSGSKPVIHRSSCRNGEGGILKSVRNIMGKEQAPFRGPPTEGKNPHPSPEQKPGKKKGQKKTNGLHLSGVQSPETPCLRRHIALGIRGGEERSGS